MCEECDDYTPPVSPVERVALGLAWIDENAEAFDLDLDRVDLDRLDIERGDLCVLGQASPPGQTYGDVRDAAYDAGQNVRGRWSLDHGFIGAGYEDYPALEGAWREAIRERRITTTAE